MSTPIYDTLAFASRILLPSWILPSPDSPLLSYQPGRTPLTTFPSVALVLIAYLGTVFGLQSLMSSKNIKPMDKPLRGPFLVHNVALAVGSFLLLACMLEEIVPFWWNRGFFDAICSEDAWTPRMEMFYLINYGFKFWELLDTFFLVSKRRPLTFLHTFHHSATALLCFSQLEGRTSISWVVITLNLAVHTLMYSYYALTCMKIKCPWKRYITLSQIAQFIIDLAVVYYALYQALVGIYNLPLPRHGHCSYRAEHAIWSGTMILTSYLFLFLAFYRKTYKTKQSHSASPRASPPMGEKRVL